MAKLRETSGSTNLRGMCYANIKGYFDGEERRGIRVCTIMVPLHDEAVWSCYDQATELFFSGRDIRA